MAAGELELAMLSAAVVEVEPESELLTGVVVDDEAETVALAVVLAPVREACNDELALRASSATSSACVLETTVLEAAEDAEVRVLVAQAGVADDWMEELLLEDDFVAWSRDEGALLRAGVPLLETAAGFDCEEEVLVEDDGSKVEAAALVWIVLLEAAADVEVDEDELEVVE